MVQSSVRAGDDLDLLCYLEEAAVQIYQGRACGCTSEFYILPDLSSVPQGIPGLGLASLAICALIKTQQNDKHGMVIINF